VQYQASIGVSGYGVASHVDSGDPVALRNILSISALFTVCSAFILMSGYPFIICFAKDVNTYFMYQPEVFRSEYPKLCPGFS